MLSAERISPDPERIKSINKLQVPTNITEIKSLLEMANFCNKLIPDYSIITAPLRQLTKKMNHSIGDHNNKLPLTS